MPDVPWTTKLKNTGYARVNHEPIASFSSDLSKSRYNRFSYFFKETMFLNCKLSHENMGSTVQEVLVALFSHGVNNSCFQNRFDTSKIMDRGYIKQSVGYRRCRDLLQEQSWDMNMVYRKQWCCIDECNLIAKIRPQFAQSLVRSPGSLSSG